MRPGPPGLGPQGCCPPQAGLSPHLGVGGDISSRSQLLVVVQKAILTGTAGPEERRGSASAPPRPGLACPGHRDLLRARAEEPQSRPRTLRHRVVSLQWSHEGSEQRLEACRDLAVMQAPGGPAESGEEPLPSLWDSPPPWPSYGLLEGPQSQVRSLFPASETPPPPSAPQR